MQLIAGWTCKLWAMVKTKEYIVGPMAIVIFGPMAILPEMVGFKFKWLFFFLALPTLAVAQTEGLETI